MSEIIMRRDDKKSLGNGYVFRATSQLVHLDGNARPYFSATFELKHNGREESGGSDSAGINQHFPQLKPVTKVHLSDDFGVPMHALANGLYWCGSSDYQEYDRDALARHLRITLEEADAVRSYVEGDAFNPEAMRYMFRALDIYKRWADDAAEAIKVITAGGNDDD